MNDIQKRKLIAVDCDGTLFDSNGHPSARTCDVVNRVIESGHHVVAATGRSRLTAQERLKVIPGMQYLICSNGAYAWDVHDNQLVWESLIPQDLVETIASKLRNTLPDACFGWETRSGIGFEDMFVELAGGASELESGGAAGDPWSQDLYKLKVRRPGVHQTDLQQEVVKLIGDRGCEITTSGAPFVEITAADTHKASGLEKTASLLDLTAAETIVFGDNHNDVSMFIWAGHAVAMGNAVDEVQQKAHAITLPNNEHGVASYLEKLLTQGLL